MMNKDKPEGPNRNGTITGYQVEAKNSDDVWKRIGPPQNEITSPCLDSEILSMVGLYEFAVANTIAWSFFAGSIQNRFTDVRLVPYRITYKVDAVRDAHRSVHIDAMPKGDQEKPE